MAMPKATAVHHWLESLSFLFLLTTLSAGTALGQERPERTLDEIGQVYGVTRERIRQIESKTMSKLRHPSRSQVLRDYLD